MNKRRVVILGGGCGGVATAWALSRTPELRRAFDVTLYQSGWRLGGKGATGRDPSRNHAVLEHGLHLWLGFYQGAFGMMKDLYDSWDGPLHGPQSSLGAAFSPMYDVALCGEQSGEGPEGTDVWRLRFPELPGRPWNAGEHSPTHWMSVAKTWATRLGSALVSEPDSKWNPGRLATLGGLVAAVVRGLGLELVRHGPSLWDRMDEEDLRAWLRRHGATQAQACSPLVGALYDLGFAYPDRRPGPSNGSMAAGTGLRVLLKTFGAYRGAPFWRMNAGMGDTVFAPAWDVLRTRGVHLRLFHRLEELRVRDGAIARVELAVQAKPRRDYDPLVTIGDIRAWPDRPRSELLENVADGDLETDTKHDLGRVTLDHREHFDDVVLAIPPSAHHRFASELIAASPRYATMVRNTTAVPTIAAQWWMERTPTQLGSPGTASVLTGIPGLFRTCADMSEVLDAEAWPQRPASLAYLCSVAPPELDETNGREEAAAWVGREMRSWAAGPLLDHWPAGRNLQGTFDPGALCGREGEDPWALQYARANVADWEQYVLSLPGQTQHRLAPDDSGFANLYLAGDWTRNAINGGSVEAAVGSGVTAAAAIEGCV